MTAPAPGSNPLPPFRTIADLVREHAAARPQHTVLVHGEQRLSWGEFDARADRVAAALQRDGVQPRQSIAISGANGIAYAVLFLGALRAGVAVAPLPTSATPPQLAGMVQDSGARLLFADESVPVLDIAVPRIALGEAPALDGSLRRNDPSSIARAETAIEPVVPAPAGTQRSAPTSVSEWLAPAGTKPRAGRRPPRLALQHHLFVGHDRHAQGHRAAAPHALGARARAGRGYGPRRGDPDSTPALLQHHAGVGSSPPRARRHRGADWPSSTPASFLALAERIAPPTPCWCRCSTSA